MVTVAPNDTQHQNDANPKNSPIDCDGVLLTNVQCPYYDIQNIELNKLKVHLKPDRKQ